MVIGGLASPALSQAPADRMPTVVLISMDGTRPDDVTLEALPSLVKLGKAGLRAAALIPVDPSNTFPSHVSLVTGVRPEQHRLVNNLFVDPIRGRFSRKAPHTWIESEPIWSIAERNGIPTASFYWVGSEGPWQGGPGPSESKKFSSRTREKTKVTQILKWLDIEDPAKRPRLITSWFHGADHAGHVSGPGAAAVAKSLVPQNEQIERLIQEMEKRNLFETTTLIFVSDHGMAEAPKRLNLGKELRRAGLQVSLLGTGGFAIGVFKDGEKTAAELERAVEIARNAGAEAWVRTEAPEDWHVADPRFGDFVVRVSVGTAIVGAMTLIDGFHGYRSTEPEMAGILVAGGRGVSKGAVLGRVSSLAIAPTVLRLLELPIPPQMKEGPISEMIRGLEANPLMTTREVLP
jgi:hypothetical protein